MCGGGDVCAMAVDGISANRLMAAVTHVGGTFWRRAQNGRTALLLTAANGHADCARLLLDAGADKEVGANVRARAGRCVRVFLR